MTSSGRPGPIAAVLLALNGLAGVLGAWLLLLGVTLAGFVIAWWASVLLIALVLTPFVAAGLSLRASGGRRLAAAAGVGCAIAWAAVIVTNFDAGMWIVEFRLLCGPQLIAAWLLIRADHVRG